MHNKRPNPEEDREMEAEREIKKRKVREEEESEGREVIEIEEIEEVERTPSGVIDLDKLDLIKDEIGLEEGGVHYNNHKSNNNNKISLIDDNLSSPEPILLSHSIYKPPSVNIYNINNNNNNNIINNNINNINFNNNIKNYNIIKDDENKNEREQKKEDIEIEEIEITEIDGGERERKNGKGEGKHIEAAIIANTIEAAPIHSLDHPLSHSVHLISSMFPKERKEEISERLEGFKREFPTDTPHAIIHRVIDYYTQLDHPPIEEIPPLKSPPRRSPIKSNKSNNRSPNKSPNKSSNKSPNKSPNKSGNKSENKSENKSGNRQRNKKNEGVDIEEEERRKERDLEMLKSLFPDCQVEYLLSRLSSLQGDDRVQLISDDMMENKLWPKLSKPKDLRIPHGRQFYNTSTLVSKTYQEHSYIKLCNLFPRVAMKKIKEVLEGNNNHFLPAVRSLERDTSLVPLRTPRKTPLPELDFDPILLSEIDFMMEENRKEAERRDREMAKEINKLECALNGELIECECCYEESPFDDFVSCADGHLFCITCMQRSASALLDMGKVELGCLYRGCNYIFKVAEMERFLDEKRYEYYQKQLLAEELRKAGLGAIDSCPFCEFSMIIDNPSERLFRCFNCSLDSCRLCKLPSHLPLRCDEVSTQKAMDMKAYMAEKMTEALLRECPSCKKKFYKEEGCNHMKCPCGQEMCYICRKPIKGYDHFNGKNSTCKLHVDTAKVNEGNIKEALEEAKEELSEAVILHDDNLLLSKTLHQLQTLIAPSRKSSRGKKK